MKDAPFSDRNGNFQEFFRTFEIASNIFFMFPCPKPQNACDIGLQRTFLQFSPNDIRDKVEKLRMYANVTECQTGS